MRNHFTFIFAIICFAWSSHAQTIPVDDNAPAKQFPYVSTVFNRIFNGNDLDSFYQKLVALKKTGSGTVNIVHIGDSHIQADFLAAVVRQNLQQYFGNAGRGLVFPYQLAQSNAPPDITSSSNTSWQFNRVAHPEIAITPGISGFCIQSTTPGASVNISLKQNDGQQSFNRLKFFTDSNTSWILQAENNNPPYMLKYEDGDSSHFKEINLDQSTSGFTISSLPTGNMQSFYGVSLENAKPGILYHTIGVNGARYDQYNIAPLFWEQLPALNADLFIVSLGTNDAQRTTFDEADFLKQVSTLLQKLHKVSPKAAILITTAPDSYYKKRPNVVLRSINLALSKYCTNERIPFWDLYRISNGYGSAYRWLQRGLMSNDRIHFTGDGYRVQGLLLFNAIAKGYNNYINSY